MNTVAEKLEYRCYLTTLAESVAAIDPLAERQYAEMCERMNSLGIATSPYNPRYEEYARAERGGYLLTFVLAHGEQLVGYCLVYLSHDMHNRDLIAQEDTIYVMPEHRNGVGRRMIRAIQDELRARGAKRINITTGTDLRVSKLLERMGYKHTAHCMTLVLED